MKNNNTIYSDDPDAIQKLKARITKLETNQQNMKAVNKIIKSKRKNYTEKQKIADLIKLGYSDKTATLLFKPDICNRIGFPDYKLTNNNSNIRRLKVRLNEIKKHLDDVSQKIQIGEIEVIDNVEENRVQVFFPDKPDEDMRNKLKMYGFRWAPSKGCWQSYRKGRQLDRVKKILS